MLTIVSSGIFAQWNAFVNNYKKDLFGRGAKTWNIQIYDENRIYFGNQNGVLEYNGNSWKLFPVEKQTDVRAIYISKNNNKIYAGGDGEFGYFEPDEKGELRYTKLSEPLITDYNLSGGYWGVFESDNLIYYVSDKHIIKQIGNDFTVIYSDNKIDCSNLVDGILLLGTTNGVKMLVGNTLLPVPGDELIKGKTVRAIVPYKSGYLIATAFDGLFHSSGLEIVPFITGAEEFLRRNEIFSLAVSPKYIAIGTIHKGLILLDQESGRTSYYNEQNGLQNNTVLSLSFDERSNLWLGLDNGIDYIPLESPFSNLYTTPNAYGSGYASLVVGNKVLLGTNRGLFVADSPIVLGEDPPKFHLIPELSGQVWGIKKIKDEIFCLHEKGLYMINGNSAHLIPGLRGALFFTEIDEHTDAGIVGAYDGFFMIEKKNSKWSVKKKIANSTEWLKNIVFLPPNILWIRALDKGMIRMTLDTTDFSIKESRLYDRSSGFGSVNDLYLHQMGNSVFFSSASGLYEYDEKEDCIAPHKKLSSCFLTDELCNIFIERNNYLYALSPGMVQIAELLPDGNISTSKAYPFSHNQIETVRYYEAMETVNDSIVIIPNGNGFALLNKEIKPKEEKKELFIKNVYITYPKDSLIYTDNFLHHDIIPEIAFNRHALRLEYAVRLFGSTNPVKYRVRLMPDTQWSDFSSATIKEYNNLKEGDYTFEVEALFLDGRTSSADFSFVILPPWYRSVYAWIAYAILFLILLRILYAYDKRRILKNRKAEAAKNEEDMLMKEQEIIQLNNEKLEQELSFKTQEMANLMINFSRKNEILMQIKEELYKISAEIKNDSSVKAKRMLIALNNSIDSNIASDDALKRFEEQFDLVHNNYIKKLKERQPDLTIGELKMCAYIKMNLSSKEIAPLLNLSIRGVETLRYRLRKKIGLEREDSLTEYLNKIS